MTRSKYRKHGLSGSRIMIIWKYMMSRCYNKDALGYQNYGGRGITVCDRWHDLVLFAKDMGHPPDGLTLDRKDNDKGYSPDNCKWSTWREQHRNKRTTVMVTAFGKTKPLMDWAEEYGVVPRTLANRLFRSKMTPEEALTQPLFGTVRGVKLGPYSNRANNRLLKAYGREQTLTAWCREFGLRQGTVREYVDERGMKSEDAINLARERLARRKR